MYFIQSKDNQIVVEVRKLKEKKYRGLQEKFLVEGFRFVSEALDSDFDVESILVSEPQQEKYSDLLIQKKLPNGVGEYLIKESTFKTICSTETPQGIIAVVKNKKVNLNLTEGMYVLVDGIQDPGNLGTIIRTADAAGAMGVLLMKGTVEPFNEKTLRSTMGSIFHLPVIECKDYSFVDKLKNNGFEVIVSSLQGVNNFYEESLKGKIVIAVGNEGNGVSAEIAARASKLVKIPMVGRAESLNAAVAASVMMYEYLRQNL